MNIEDTFMYFYVSRGLANILICGEVIEESEQMLFIVHTAV